MSLPSDVVCTKRIGVELAAVAVAAATAAVEPTTTEAAATTTAEQKCLAAVRIEGSRRRCVIDLHVSRGLAHRAGARFLIRGDGRGALAIGAALMATAAAATPKNGVM